MKNPVIVVTMIMTVGRQKMSKKGKPPMSLKRQRRLYAAHQAVASRLAADEFFGRLEMSTVWVLAAVIIAMEDSHCKVKYENWYKRFAEIYPELIKDPQPYIDKAEAIVGEPIEIHWEE